MSLPENAAKYLAIATAVCFGESKNGNTQVAVECEVVDHPEFTGETITWTGTFAEGKATDIAIEALQNFGWKGDDVTELADIGAADCRRLMPDIVELKCAMEEYEGENRLKVSFVNKPGAGGMKFKKPLAATDLKAFAAQMRGTIRGAQQNGGRRPTPSNGSQTSRATEQPHPNAPSGWDPARGF